MKYKALPGMNYDPKCECFCGCTLSNELFECCETWFCSNCFADHIEDVQHGVDDGTE